MLRLCIFWIAAATISACTSDADNRESASPPEVRNRALQVEVVGGGAAQRRLLRRLVAAAQVTRIERVTFADPATWSRLTRPRAHPALDFLTRANNGGSAARATWEAMIVAGAYTDTVGYGRRPASVGVRFTGVSPKQYPTGSIPNPSPSRMPRRSVITAAAAIERIRKVAAMHNLAIESTEVATPLGLAIAVRAVARDQERFIRDRARIIVDLTETVADPDHPLTDGAYLAVYNDRGILITATGYATRIRVGNGWNNPKYQPAR